jgi:hypothetical protein
MNYRFFSIVLGITTVCAVFGIGTNINAVAEIFYSEDFENLPTGDIDGRDHRWWVDKSSPWGDAVGEVLSVSYAHSGQKALSLAAGYSLGPWVDELKEVEWQDQTPSMPHGGWIELSWWMYPYYNNPDRNRWQIYVTGLSASGPGNVAILGNKEIMPDTQLDAYINDQWQQFYAFLPCQSWKKIVLQVDFAQSPDRYRFCVLDSDQEPLSDDWYPNTEDHSQWYSLRSDPNAFDAEYLGVIGFANQSSSNIAERNLVIDDFQARTVPEPYGLSLLACAAIMLLRRICWRTKNC